MDSIYVITLLSNFLSGHSIYTAIYVQCSIPKSNNSGVPQGSAEFPILSIAHNYLSKTISSVSIYADSSTLYSSTLYNKQFSQQESQLNVGRQRMLNLWPLLFFNDVKAFGITQGLKNLTSPPDNSTQPSRHSSLHW